MSDSLKRHIHNVKRELWERELEKGRKIEREREADRKRQEAERQREIRELLDTPDREHPVFTTEEQIRKDDHAFVTIVKEWSISIKEKVQRYEYTRYSHEIGDQTISGYATYTKVILRYKDEVLTLLDLEGRYEEDEILRKLHEMAGYSNLVHIQQWGIFLPVHLFDDIMRYQRMKRRGPLWAH